jgi:hypothetical protein
LAANAFVFQEFSTNVAVLAMLETFVSVTVAMSKEAFRALAARVFRRRGLMGRVDVVVQVGSAGKGSRAMLAGEWHCVMG